MGLHCFHHGVDVPFLSGLPQSWGNIMDVGHVSGLWATTMDFQSPNAASLLKIVADPGQPCWAVGYISTASAVFCQDGWGKGGMFTNLQYYLLVSNGP